MQQQLLNFATQKPRLVYGLVAALCILLGLQLLKINIDTDPENMLPADQAERVFHNKVEADFILHDAIVVGLVNKQSLDGIYNPESLAALHTLTKAILQLDGVIAADLMSLATADNISQGQGGAIRFEWMMKEAPRTLAGARAIRDHVQRLPLLNNTLVSADGKAAAVYVPIARKDLSYRIAGEIQALADEIEGPTEFHITGLPVAEDTFGTEMFVQMGISAPLAGLMIFLLMAYFFGSWRLVIAPMIVALATVIITMGLLIGLGYTVHIMSSMIPIFLMPIAVVDSVHLLSEFADSYREEAGPEQSIRHVTGQLFKPMLFTSLTSAAGFLSLMLTPIPPVQIFGAFVAIGILLAFILTIVFVPAYLVRMSPQSLALLARQGEDMDHAKSTLAKILRRLGGFAFARPWPIILTFLFLTGISLVGLLRIEINDNPVRWFKADHRIRIADAVLNEHFAGTYDAFLVLSHEDESALPDFRTGAKELLDEAAAQAVDVDPLSDALSTLASMEELGAFVAMVDDAVFAAENAGLEPLESLLEYAENFQNESKYFQQPAALAFIEDLQNMLLTTGGVGKTNALPDVVKVVTRELRGGDPSEYKIPSSAQAVAQTLLQYQSSHRPQDLWHLVTPDLRSTAIWLQLRSGDNKHMSAVIDATDEFLRNRPLPAGVSAQWAGKTYINVVWQQAMVTGMLKSLLGAFAAVFLMMSLLFRSLRLGLMAMLPLSITIVFVYGLIGWVGKDYDMPIAVLSALSLGLSVDFAIHFIQRLRSLNERTGSFNESARLLFEEPARAISRNALVIALGFTPLFLAPLMPYVTVGAFMASIMAFSSVATLILLPAAATVSRSSLAKENNES